MYCCLLVNIVTLRNGNDTFCTQNTLSMRSKTAANKMEFKTQFDGMMPIALLYECYVFTMKNAREEIMNCLGCQDEKSAFDTIHQPLTLNEFEIRLSNMNSRERLKFQAELISQSFGTHIANEAMAELQQTFKNRKRPD